MKKKKNGFTLIELLAVIVILALLLVIATLLVNRQIKESREKAKKIVIDEIENVGRTYLATESNCEDENGGNISCSKKDKTVCVSAKTLVEKGYLEDDLTNPDTGENIKETSEVEDIKFCKINTSTSGSPSSGETSGETSGGTLGSSSELPTNDDTIICKSEVYDVSSDGYTLIKKTDEDSTTGSTKEENTRTISGGSNINKIHIKEDKTGAAAHDLKAAYFRITANGGGNNPGPGNITECFSLDKIEDEFNESLSDYKSLKINISLWKNYILGSKKMPKAKYTVAVGNSNCEPLTTLLETNYEDTLDNLSPGDDISNRAIAGNPSVKGGNYIDKKYSLIYNGDLNGKTLIFTVDRTGDDLKNMSAIIHIFKIELNSKKIINYCNANSENWASWGINN